MFEQITKLCERENIAISRLCETITGSKGNLPTWRKNNIKSDVIVKIADYFKVSTNYLFGRNEYIIDIDSQDANIFNNEQVLNAYKSLSEMEKLEIQVEILRKSGVKNEC